MFLRVASCTQHVCCRTHSSDTLMCVLPTLPCLEDRLVEERNEVEVVVYQKRVTKVIGDVVFFAPNRHVSARVSWSAVVGTFLPVVAAATGIQTSTPVCRGEVSVGCGVREFFDGFLIRSRSQWLHVPTCRFRGGCIGGGVAEIQR